MKIPDPSGQFDHNSIRHSAFDVPFEACTEEPVEISTRCLNFNKTRHRHIRNTFTAMLAIKIYKEETKTSLIEYFNQYRSNGVSRIRNPATYRNYQRTLPQRCPILYMYNVLNEHRRIIDLSKSVETNKTYLKTSMFTLNFLL